MNEMLYHTLVVFFVVLPSVFVAGLVAFHTISDKRVSSWAKRALLWAWPPSLGAAGLLAGSEVWRRKGLSWGLLDEFLIRLTEDALLLSPLVFLVLFIGLVIVFSRTHPADRMSGAYLLTPLAYSALAFTIGVTFRHAFENHRTQKFEIPPLEQQWGFKLETRGFGVAFTWINPEGSLGRAGVRAGDYVRAHHGVASFVPFLLLARDNGPTEMSCTPLSELKKGWDVARAKRVRLIVEENLYQRLAPQETSDILRGYVPLLSSNDYDAYEAMVALEFVVLQRGADRVAGAVPDLVRRLKDLDDGPKQIAAPLRINAARILGEMGPVAREALPALKAAAADPRSGADPDALSVPEYAGDLEVFRAAALEAVRKIEGK